MKFIIAISFLLLIIPSQIVAQDHTVRMHIEGVKHNSGLLMVGFFDNTDDFKLKENPVYKKRQPVSDSVVQLTFEQIKEGRYAIAVYHDENDDQEMNTKKLGIPTEGVGFSGIKKSKLKPPNFDDASFYLVTDTVIYIRMRYPK